MRRKSYRVLIGIAAIISIHVTSMFIYFSYISVQNINKDRQLLPHSPRTNHDRNDNGPMTFFHVGPIKTASSSIQCNLESNPHLLNSSYYYLGKIERKCQNLHLLRGKNGGYASGVSLVNQYFVRGWLRESVLEDHPEFRQFIHEWKGGMRSRYKKGLHTLFSSEDFCGLRRITNFHNETEEYRPKMIVDFLQSTPQNVRFQLVYRDYFDWLPSLFTWSEYSAIEGARFQDFDNFGSGNGMSSIVSWRFIDDMISFEHVTDKYFLLNTKKEHTLGCNPYNLWKHLKKFIPLFDEGRASLEILDIFHNHGNYSHDTAMETEDIGTRYICKLPNATLACQGSRNMTFGRSNPTPMDFIHADRIAVAAWRNGLFADPEAVKPKRKAVVDSIMRRVREDLNVTFLDLPLECLSEEKLGRLFQTSVIMSKEMMGEDGFYCVDAMKERFQRNVDQKKYCSVKIDAILADESWREFLKMADLT